MSAMKRRFGFEDQNTENDSFFNSSDNEDTNNIGKYFSLSHKNRFIGWGIFTVLGLALAILSTIVVFSAHYVAFGVLYTFGNVCLIIASLFLFGPLHQLKSMFSTCHKSVATCTYLCTIIITLIIALKAHSGIGCLIFVIFQFAAYIWYTIVSFPGGQTMCETTVKNTIRV